MRKISRTVVALSVVSTVALTGAAVGADSHTADMKIGLVTDVGSIDDRGFNENSWAGTLAGAEGVGAPEPQFVISQTSADIKPNIQAFVDQQYDIIVTVGFAAGADTLEAAKANPDINFIGVDQGVCVTEDGENDISFQCPGDPAVFVPNYQGIGWREQQPGYLAGIVAASVSETGHIGAVGGTFVIPAVVNYIEGYANGALSVNPDATVSVVYASTAPDTAAFNDPAGGQALAQQMLAQDPEIDVFFQVAGKTGNGVLQAACDADIFGIGVDVDQFESLPETAACTVTSAEKKLSKNVNDAIVKVVEGNVTPGTNILGIDTQDVGLSSFHDFEALISNDTRARLAEAEAGLADGSLSPCEAQAGSGFCVQTLGL